jgi:hypothetical protein
MDASDLARFEAATGFALPTEMVGLDAFPPFVESDVDRLIQLNRDVRQPGVPYLGDTGGPWPNEHVVIGEDQSGNYWSVVTSDQTTSVSTAVWFFDHETGRLTESYRSIERFLGDMKDTHKPDVFAVGDWTIRAQTSVGPIRFGMTPEQVRTALNAPYTSFKKSPLSTDLTDAFDTLGLHTYYRDGRCEAVEFFETADVRLGGHRLGDETFNDMVQILYDPLVPLRTTPTSCISPAFGVEFSVDGDDNTAVVGAIHMIIVTDRGYFDRQDAALQAILGDDYRPGSI